jgi:hypothetical protein
MSNNVIEIDDDDDSVEILSDNSDMVITVDKKNPR